MSNILLRGTPWTQTASGTIIAVATQAGVANQTLYVTDVTASADSGTATVVITAGSTIIWQDRIGNTAAYEHSFATPLPGVTGTTINVTVKGNGATNANVSGVILDNT